MLRRSFLKISLALGITLGMIPRLALAQSGDDAQKFVSGLAQQAITTVANRQLSQPERDDRFRKLFVSSFDIPEIGKFVLSRFWRTTSPEQQQEFISLFEDITVLTWSKRFQDYNGESLEPLGVAKDGDKGWLVDSRILRNQGPPIPVQWRIKEADAGSFRVVDIVVEGVSMAITLRSDYAAALQGNGGRIDGLLAIMRTKIDQLRAAG
jgi:phospholipid transport system substrate-binding protein